ncbi:MAG: hypothetical protein ACK58L_03220 [Planctomycetota bacterium]
MKSHFLTLCALLAVTSLLRADDLPGNDALTIEVRGLATDFAKIIEKKGGGAVAIGEFSGSSDIKGSVGPRLQLTLAAELEALKIRVDSEDYRFEIKGDYQPLEDKETKLLGVKLVGRLIDRETGEPLAEKPTGRFVFGAETVPTMLGLNVQPKPGGDAREISDAAKKALKSPTVHLNRTRLCLSPAASYAIEILVRDGDSYQPHTIVPDSKGRPFVELHNDAIYGVRLINDSDHTAAVDLRIDGVSSFAFSETKSEFWIIDPHSHVDIIGWHKSNDKSTEFKVVEDFSDSAVAKLNLKPSASVGLITAAFRAAWEPDAMPPADEPKLLADLGGRERSATGFGNDVGFRTRQVSLNIGAPRDIISVRYNR